MWLIVTSRFRLWTSTDTIMEDDGKQIPGTECSNCKHNCWMLKGYLCAIIIVPLQMLPKSRTQRPMDQLSPRCEVQHIAFGFPSILELGHFCPKEILWGMSRSHCAWSCSSQPLMQSVFSAWVAAYLPVWLSSPCQKVNWWAHKSFQQWLCWKQGRPCVQS